MKHVFLALLLIPALAFAEEDWKGTPPSNEMTVGALAGLGVINSTGGFTLLGTFAKKIVHQGFIPDINNQVFIEAEAGPFTSKGASAFLYSVHLRWDFIMDPGWTFYGLGGLGGNITGAALGDQFQLLPRFGAGVILDLESLPFSLRGEVSHEITAVGVSFRL